MLWEYLIENLCSSKTNEITTDYIKLENIRKLLGVLNNKSYDNYAILRAQALLPALKEINDKSDITVTLTPKREGRKVVYICFNVKRKVPVSIENDSHKPMIPPNNFKIGGIENNEGKLIDAWLNTNCLNLRFSIDNIKKDIIKFGEERVKKAMQITVDAVEKDTHIKSLKAYYLKALQDNWDRNISSTEVKQSTNCKEMSLEINTLLNQETGIASDLKRRLYECYGEIHFKSWFKDLKIKESNANTMNIKAENEFKAERIITDYQEKIKEILKTLAPHIEHIEIEI